MAATDQHFRSQKTLDIVFGLSCAAMLLTTVWMLAQDFNRDFKAVQRQFRDVEATISERDAIGQLPRKEDLDEARLAVQRARRKLEVAGASVAVADIARTFTILRDEKSSENERAAARKELDEAKARFEDEFYAWRDRQGESDAARLAAQRKLEAGHAKFVANEQRIKALRENADDTYRGIKADYDAQMSYYNIAVDDAGKEPEGSTRQKAFKKQAEDIRKKLDGLDARLASAKEKLDTIDARMKMEVRDVLAPFEKDLSDRDEAMKRLTRDFDRFAKASVQKGWQIGDAIRALPIVDGFQSPIKINQIWLPDLTIDYGGFRDVPRFDRCTTCHLGIDRKSYTRESLAALGDQEESKRLTTKLEGAKEMLLKRQRAGENLGFDPNYLPGERSGNIWLIINLLLASSVVAAGSLGALERSWRVGLNTLLVCVGITAVTGLFLSVFAPVTPKVKDIKLTEGEITQFCAHPRMDLFVDGNSPHPAEKFGCTTCHAGQGSATEFKLSEHTPNDSNQEHAWKKQHGWASSHYWDFPMLPKRFTESGCLKCHPQVTDLVRHGSKEEAPKLLRGYNIIKDVGCFGCHEIQGMKGGRPIGPDLRLEPSPSPDLLTPAEQARINSDPANPPGNLRKVGPSLRRLSEKVTDDWTRKWVLDPRGFRDDTKMPHFYGLSTNSPEVLPDEQKKFPDAEIRAISHYLMEESKRSLEGKDFYRESLLSGAKSLASMQKKLGESGLSDKEMKELLDVTRRFTDLAMLSAPMNHATINDKALAQRQLQDRLAEIQKRAAEMRNRREADSAVEAVVKSAGPVAQELASVTADLEAASKPVQVKSPGKQVFGADNKPIDIPSHKDGNALNGRLLFTEKGCLACHAHQGTTQNFEKDGKTIAHAVTSDANFGPELSRIHEKLPAKGGYEWLVQWIINPNVHHPRTKMPITHLSGKEAGDIATWLLSSKGDWKGKGPGEVTDADLVKLARVYLGKAPGMTKAELDRILPDKGNLSSAGFDKVDGLGRDADERVLLKGNEGIKTDTLLWYVGKKAIGRQGCYACHDIPGFETAKPIGVGLNDWGRKDHDRIAFEDGADYAKHHFNIVPTRTTAGEVEARIKVLKAAKTLNASEDAELRRLEKRVKANERLHELEVKAKEGKATAAEKAELHELHGQKFFESDGKKPSMEEIFFESLEHHRREGFLNLKLMEPRSYDHNRIKAWDDRLRMPQFKFARTRKKVGEGDKEFQARAEKEEAEAREAVMTFVLGLVAEPVPLKYVNLPKGDKGAEAAGRKVLDKYNCGSCHQIRPGVFEFDFTPETLARMERSHATAIGVNGSEQVKDHVFANHSAWGGPAPTSERRMAFGYLDAVASERDDNDDLVWLTEAFRFTGSNKLSKDISAGSNLRLPKGRYSATNPYGGTWTDVMTGYLRRKDSTKFGSDDKQRTVLPPPLVREGERVQTDWLYRFLLNPTVIRPETNMLLRMPRFNMSPDESRALVNYFGAAARAGNPAAGITYPYSEIPQRDPAYWPRVSAEYRAELTRIAEGKGDRAKFAGKQLADAKKGKGTQGDPYAVNAFALIGNQELCVKCHNVGDKTNIEGPQGPNLVLAADRLRPEWVEQWIAHPKRMFTYLPAMPPNFPNDTDPLKWAWQKEFAGTPIQQTRAVRDLLMDRRRLEELLPTYTPPKKPPAKGEK